MIKGQAEIQAMLKKKSLAVLYPKDKTKKSAQKIANMLETAVAIAAFKDENDNLIWGVLVNKNQEAEETHDSEL